MIRVRPVRQMDRSDCGAACLCSIAGAYGYRLPLSRVRELASTGTGGTNVMGLVEAADKMGFIAKGVKGPPGSLGSAPLPSIAHLKTENNFFHFVVLTRIGSRYARYMDPGQGTVRKVRLEELEKQWTGVLVIVAPGSQFKKANENPATGLRLLGLVHPFRRVLLQALAGAALYSLLGLSTSLFVQKIMDFVLLNHNTNLLNLLGTAMIGILLIRTLISWFKSLYLLKTGHQIDAGLLMGYYRHLLSLPQRFFDTRRTGEILSRMNDAIKIRVFINQSLVEMIVAGITILLTLLAMAVLSSKLFLLVLSSLLIYLVIYTLSDLFNKKLLRRLMEKMAGLESQLVESIQIQRTIRESGWKSWAVNRTSGKISDVLRVSYGTGIAAILTSISVELVSGLLTIIMLWSGAISVIGGTLSPGELMSFYAMLGYLLGPVKNLTGMNRMFRDALIAADRLFQILDLEQEKNTSCGIPVLQLNQDIEFQDIGFRYGARPELFNGLSFSIPCGKMTGIVGRSGSGKSSIAAMLLAEYLPDRGSLLINNCDIRQLDRRSLRRKTGLVPQHVELFPGSILENISPGEADPDMARLLECSRRTGLIRLLRDLPEGFNTAVGEHGKNLSGGERQRIALTRALYHEPELLILDEATAALDPVSESGILALIEDLRKDSMTLVIISHKLRQVCGSDHIVMIDGGRAAGEGTHEALIASDGPYRELWYAQNHGN